MYLTFSEHASSRRTFLLKTPGLKFKTMQSSLVPKRLKKLGSPGAHDMFSFPLKDALFAHQTKVFSV